MLGLFAGEIENDVLMATSPPLWHGCSQLVQYRWAGAKALGQCPGAGRGHVAWLCPSGDRGETPRVWGEGRWSLPHRLSTQSTSSQAPLATVSF